MPPAEHRCGKYANVQVEEKRSANFLLDLKAHTYTRQNDAFPNPKMVSIWPTNASQSNSIISASIVFSWKSDLDLLLQNWQLKRKRTIESPPMLSLLKSDLIADQVAPTQFYESD